LLFFFQIYITTTKLEHFPLVIFVFVTANLPKLTYMKSVGMRILYCFIIYSCIIAQLLHK